MKLDDNLMPEPQNEEELEENIEKVDEEREEMDDYMDEMGVHIRQ